MEPDRVDFIHAGFSCFIQRGPVGAWCGYVGVPASHPAYGKDYNDVDVAVHGGLTYCGACDGSICHTPAEGMPDDVWWLGFDTNHWQDVSPVDMGKLLDMIGYKQDGVYRNVNYATKETMELAEQLALMGGAK